MAVVIGAIGTILILVLALVMVKNVHKKTKLHEEVRCLYFICINTLLLYFQLKEMEDLSLDNVRIFS